MRLQYTKYKIIKPTVFLDKPPPPAKFSKNNFQLSDNMMMQVKMSGNRFNNLIFFEASIILEAFINSAKLALAFCKNHVR